MTGLSRRSFLSGTSAGAVTLGVLAAAPCLAAASAVADDPAGAAAPAPAGPLMALVRDAALGEVSVFIGDREIVVRDPGLVARLVRAGS